MADGLDWVLRSDQNGVQVRLHIEGAMEGPASPCRHKTRTALLEQGQEEAGPPSLRPDTSLVARAYFTGGFRFAAPKGSSTVSLYVNSTRLHLTHRQAGNRGL